MDAVKVIAEPRRREILRLCWRDERSAGELADAFDITFGAVSQHLKVLRDAELVTVRQRRHPPLLPGQPGRRWGRWPPTWSNMWGHQIDRLAALAEATDAGDRG